MLRLYACLHCGSVFMRLRSLWCMGCRWRAYRMGRRTFWSVLT